MTYDIRLPNITATTEKGQLEQMRSYLYQFAEQLQYAVNVINLNTEKTIVQVKEVSSSIGAPTQEQKLQQFNNLKNLIISSADIINAYSEEIKYRLSGEYVAHSEFGTFREETTKQVEENSESLTEHYTMLQSIDNWRQDTTAYVRTGYLENIDNLPAYGVELGQKTVDEAGNTLSEGMVRFTPTKTIFYDGFGNQMAILSNQELIIDGIVCRGNFYIGNFVVSASLAHGFSIKPTGRVI